MRPHPTPEPTSQVLDDDRYMANQPAGSLSRAECIGHLGRIRNGRLAFSDRALPAILPVNFALLGDHIVFKSGAGGHIDSALLGSVVAFQVDDLDCLDDDPWTVCVVGVVAEVTDPAMIDVADVTRLRPIGHASRLRNLQLSLDVVRGERVAR